MKRRLAVLLSLAPFLVGGGPRLALALESAPIPQSEAAILAQVFTDKLANSSFPEWLGAIVQQPLLFRDTDNQPRLWSFSVVKDGQELGYVSVAASKTTGPFLEASTGTPLSTALEAAVTTLKSQAKAVDLASPRLVHLGAMTYLAIFDSSGVGANEPLIYDLKQSAFLSSLSESDLSSVPFQTITEAQRTTWQLLHSANKTPISTNAVSHILPWSRNFSQNSATCKVCACGPTSGANLLQWWRDHGGYTSIKGVSSYGNSAKNFIDHVHLDMNAFLWGTSVVDYEVGLIRHLGESGLQYDFVIDSVGFPGTNFNHLMTELNRRPVAIRIERNQSLYWSYHWVTAVGYETDQMYLWNGVLVLDGYGSTDWLDYDAYQPYMSFVTMRPR